MKREEAYIEFLMNKQVKFHEQLLLPEVSTTAEIKETI